MRLREGRVVVPADVARSLSSWFPKPNALIQCVAVVVEIGRVVVVPEEVAEMDESIREWAEARHGHYPDLASALMPQGQDVPEIASRLRVTRASIDHPSNAHRLHLSKNLFPLLDLGPKERRLYLYKVADHLEVASVAFARKGISNMASFSLES